MRVKSGKSERRPFGKAFDGWQLGLGVVLAAWAVVMLVVPRPAVPLEVPEPHVSPREIALLRTAEAQLETRALAGLPDASRALGTAIRKVGRAEANLDGLALGAAQSEVARAVSAMPPDLRALLSLRAMQTARFVRAVREWESSGVASRDIDELGGSLVTAFRDAGWSIDEGDRSRMLMDDDVLGVAFRKRWNEIVRLKGGLAAQTLTEEKLLFGFAIRHARTRRSTSDPVAARGLGAPGLLRRIDAYARLDPSYPVDFARGVAYFGAHAFGPAQAAFQRHLEAHPDGPLTLRARNFGRAALIADVEGVVP